MNMYVSNLGFNVSDEDLKKLFTPYGSVDSAKVINDRDSGKSRGFGFVEMGDDTAARKAMTELHNKSIDGRALSVTEARPREDKNRGGGGFSKSRW